VEVKTEGWDRSSSYEPFENRHLIISKVIISVKETRQSRKFLVLARSESAKVGIM
jgi:hypothetical protein